MVVGEEGGRLAEMRLNYLSPQDSRSFARGLDSAPPVRREVPGRLQGSMTSARVSSCPLLSSMLSPHPSSSHRTWPPPAYPTVVLAIGTTQANTRQGAPGPCDRHRTRRQRERAGPSSISADMKEAEQTLCLSSLSRDLDRSFG